MIKVAVSGAAGQMGRLVAGAVAAAPDLEVAACFDPGRPGVEVGGQVTTADPGAVAGADVVVEFTTPDVVIGNLAEWYRLGAHAVVGTSGFDAERVVAAQEVWGATPPNCLIVPNFSIGAVVLMRLARMAAPHFDAAEVIELHHDRKADAPSGTALATAAEIAAAAEQRRAVESAELVPGARGARVEGVPVHSVRLPGLVAHQEVVFGATGQTLSLRHDTTDRSAFLPGVLLAVRRVGDVPGVTVGLEAVLGD